MPPLFVTPPFSPWRPGDAFNQEKEVKYKRKRKRGEKTKRKNKEVNKSKEKERKTCGSKFFLLLQVWYFFTVTLFVGQFNLGTLKKGKQLV